MKTMAVEIKKPDDSNIIIGQAHFIKSAEDIYEALVVSVPQIRFGAAFCESSGPCLVRSEGNDDGLKECARENAMRIGAGHCFVIVMRDAYPLNVLSRLRSVDEICAIHCATANPVEVIVAQTQQGRGILGVIDGSSPKGVEGEGDIKKRKAFLRSIGYKL